MKCLRALSKARDIFPESFTCDDIVTNGKHPIDGGGLSVSVWCWSHIQRVLTYVQDIWEGVMGGKVVCLKVLRLFGMSHTLRKNIFQVRQIQCQANISSYLVDIVSTSGSSCVEAAAPWKHSSFSRVSTPHTLNPATVSSPHGWRMETLSITWRKTKITIVWNVFGPFFFTARPTTHRNFMVDSRDR